MNRWITSGLLIAVLLVISGQTLYGTPRIIPTPQHQVWDQQTVRFEKGSDSTRLVLAEGASAKERLAAELIHSQGGSIFPPPTFLKGAAPEPIPGGIYLVDWSRDGILRKQADSLLEPADRDLLSDPARAEQGYVLKVVPGNQPQVWLVGGSAQGVLYAAASLQQVTRRTGSAVLVPNGSIRDFPDFRYRAAADWLLFAEINRWAYDWGDGKQAYVERIKRKIDFCLRYKINLVFFDGYGWNREKFPGYSRMMRQLNSYARARGIKLLFAGYGANYGSIVRPEHNVGKVWYNRDRYPDGTIYSCFGENRPGRGIVGTCRGNEALNRLKAAEMADFVRSVEPGALYIHHEDRGIGDPNIDYHLTNYELWVTWKKRCFRCRKKWPNDSLLTKDGGAGAVAHAYSELLRAIRSVKNADSGYDAARDCTVLFVSPGYNPFPTQPTDWENHLIFWSNVVSLLPDDENFEIGFREIFPQQGTGVRWLDAYRQRLGSQGLNTRTFLFFLGGADLYSRDSFNYPFAGTAAMNGIFKGAETIYNFSGAVFQEPLQLFNAEYSWNVNAPGHVIPSRYEETKSTWKALMNNRDLAPEITGPTGFLAEAFRQLYGDDAGAKMHRIFNFYRTQRRVEVPEGLGRTIMATHYDRTVDQVYGSEIDLLVPVAAERLYPLSILWRILDMDKVSGGPELSARTKELMALVGIDSVEWQKRWAELWQAYDEVNTEAVALASEVLQTSDLRADARPDVEYLRKCLHVGRGFARVLNRYHEALAASLEKRGRDVVDPLVAQANNELEALASLLNREFTFDTVDPLGGDQATWLEGLHDIKARLQELSTDPMDQP